MAHLSSSALPIYIGDGEGTSTQGSGMLPFELKREILREELMDPPPPVQEWLCGIPEDLRQFLPEITLLKPDKWLLHYFKTEEATLIVWSTKELKENELKEVQDWVEHSIRVQNQGDHSDCWARATAENISDAMCFNNMDNTYTTYSSQFLVDFCNDTAAAKKILDSRGKHYCYGYPTYKALLFAMVHGIATTEDWRSAGCDGIFKCNRDVNEVKRRHVLNDVRAFTDVKKAVRYLETQPILGSLALYEPEFIEIEHRVYRGPTSYFSKFSGWHSVSIRRIYIDTHGETIALIKNTHGEKHGFNGYVRVSLDVMLVEIKTRGIPSLKSPSRLFRNFFYGEVRSQYEKKIGRLLPEVGEITENLAYLIHEGMYHNTTGRVYEVNGENEIIGSPIDRALFKWAIQYQEDKQYVYEKSDSTTIKGCPSNSQPECLGVAVNCERPPRNGIRIHWKGNAAFILDKCTRFNLHDNYIQMSIAKRNELKNAIDDMVANKLICIALAFKEIDRRDLPPHDETKQWKLPHDDLILLAIFGIKDPCPPAEDDERRAPIDFHQMPNEQAIRNSVWNDGEILIAPDSDLEDSDVGDDNGWETRTHASRG